MRSRIPLAAGSFDGRLRQLGAQGLVRILALPAPEIPPDALRAAVESEREEG